MGAFWPGQPSHFVLPNQGLPPPLEEDPGEDEEVLGRQRGRLRRLQTLMLRWRYMLLVLLYFLLLTIAPLVQDYTATNAPAAAA